MRKYTGKSSFSRIFEILAYRNRQLGEQLKSFAPKAPRKRVLGSIALAGAISLGTVGDTIKKEDKIIEEPEKYVVTYSYTNAYTEVPEYNKLGRLTVNEIIEFDISDDTYWTNSEDGDWKHSISTDTETSSKWVKCTTNINEEEKTGFVPSMYVDKYVSYSGNSINVRNVPNSKDDSSIIAVIGSEDKVYVSEEINNTDEFGCEWSRVIVKKNNAENEDYIIGYVASNLLTRDMNDSHCMGFINNSTFLRTYPVVTELQEDIIKGMVNNGQEVDVLKKCKSGEETWYECRIEGPEDEIIYLSSNSIKKVQDFETDYTFEQIRSAPITNSSGDIRATIYPGDTLKINTDSRNSKGEYEVMANGYTGYVNSEYLDVPKINLFEKKVWKKFEIEEKINEQEIGEDKITYIVDLSGYNNFKAYKKMIDEIKEKDKLGAVVFSIGRTSQVTNFSIGTFIDNDEEYRKYISGDTSVDVLQEKYDEIAKKGNFSFNKNVRGMGNFEDVVNCIEYAIEQDIPIGYYYYSCAITPNEASSEAAYISAILEKIENDIGKEYKNATILPFMIDVEYAGEYRMKNKEGRTKAVSLVVDLLGNGTDNPECWTRKGYKPKEGYNIINELFSYYGDTNHVAFTDDQTKALAAENVISLQSVEESTSEYEMIRFLTRAIIPQEEEMKDEYLDPNYILNLMKKNKYYNGENGKMSRQVTESADIMQCLLDVKYGDVEIDLSISTTNTIQEILNGTYKHDKYGDFLTKLENTIQAEADRKRLNEEVDKNDSNEEIEMQTEIETEMEH